MPPEKNDPNDERDADRLGRALRSLPRVHAPWTFEGELRQRIWGVRPAVRSRRLFPSPLPGYLIPTLALVAVAIVGYLQFFTGGVPEPGPNELRIAVPAVTPPATPRVQADRAPRAERNVPSTERVSSGPSPEDAGVRIPASPSRIRDSAVVSGLRRKLSDTIGTSMDTAVAPGGTKPPSP
jgi:hypothetical protein